MAEPVVNEKFINWITGTPMALFAALSSVFNGSGANATIGLVPSPGATPGTPLRFLREDSTWASPLLSSTNMFAATFIMDGGTAVPTTGIKGDIRIPWAATLTKVTLLADAAGTATVDIWKDTYANYPPTVADTIILGGGTKPNLAGPTDHYEDGTLTNWNKTFAAGDTIRFNLDAVTVCKRIAIIMEFTKT